MISQLPAAAAGPQTRVLRGAVRSTASYLARWQRRTTPFGLFAAVTTAESGARAAAGSAQLIRWSSALTRNGSMLLLTGSNVSGCCGTAAGTADNAGYVRDGRLIIAPRPAPGVADGISREISVPCTRPVAAVFELAGGPVRFGDLAAQLCTRYPAIARDKISGLLHGLFDDGFLISNLRPPATAPDGLEHLVSALRSASARDFTDLSGWLDQLDEVAMMLRTHHAGREIFLQIQLYETRPQRRCARSPTLAPARP